MKAESQQNKMRWTKLFHTLDALNSRLATMDVRQQQLVTSFKSEGRSGHHGPNLGEFCTNTECDDYWGLQALHIGDISESAVRMDKDRRLQSFNGTAPDRGAITGGSDDERKILGFHSCCDGGACYHDGEAGAALQGLPVAPALPVFDEMLDYMIWDEELLHDFNSHDKLLLQLAQGQEFIGRQESVMECPLLQSPPLLDKMPYGDAIWDEDLSYESELCRGLLEQLARGEEFVVGEKLKLIADSDSTVETHGSDIPQEHVDDSMHEQANASEKAKTVIDELVVFIVLTVSERTTDEVFSKMPNAEFVREEELQIHHNLLENLLLRQTTEHSEYLAVSASKLLITELVNDCQCIGTIYTDSVVWDNYGQEPDDKIEMTGTIDLQCDFLQQLARVSNSVKSITAVETDFDNVLIQRSPHADGESLYLEQTASVTKQFVAIMLEFSLVKYELGLPSALCSPVQVTLANGETLIFYRCVSMLDVGVYDVILGFLWLKQCSPMLCHWKQKTLNFQENGVAIHLQGLVPQELGRVIELSVLKLQKRWQGNEIWALAVVESISESVTPVSPSAVDELFLVFRDLFDNPKQSPLSLLFDSAIHLLPTILPVNEKLSRYSSLHQIGVVCPATALLVAELLTSSVCPLVSPVLKGQEIDGTWCFYIAYSKLHSLTIQNNLHMPLVDAISAALAKDKEVQRSSSKLVYQFWDLMRSLKHLRQWLIAWHYSYASINSVFPLS